MTNGYFNHENPEARHTIARAESLNATFQAVQSGFDRLPAEDDLKQGKATSATVTGGSAAYVATLPYPPLAYAAGLRFSFKVPATNAGASTLNVIGFYGAPLGVKAIKRFNGANTLPADLTAGAIADVEYDGAAFVLVGAHGATETRTAADSANATAQAIIATNKTTEAQGYANAAGNSATAALGYANAAGAAVAGVNMPSVTVADAGKGIEVKPDGSGWQLVSILKTIGGTLTGWLQTHSGADASNLGLRIGEAASGFYRSAAGVLGFVVNGIEVFRTASTGGVTFYKPVVPKVLTLPWASSITPDLTAANKFAVTLNGPTGFAAPTLTAAMVGMEFTIIPMQDAIGNRAVTFDPIFNFPIGIAPTASTAPGKRDRVVCEVVTTAAGALAIDAVYVKGF